MGRDKSTISREIKRGTGQQLDTFRKHYEKILSLCRYMCLR